MKYTIEGFSQQYALSLKREVNENGKTKVIKIDCTDLLILRWFVDFYPNMKRFNINGSEFAWVNYQKLLDDMPLMNIGKQMLFLRLQKMVSFGILTHHTIKNSCGTYSCYGFGSEYVNLISDGATEITDGIQNIIDGVGNKLQTGSIINYRPNNSSTIQDSSTIQNSPKKVSKPKSGYDVIVCEYTKNDELKEAIYEFIKMRKMIKKPMTDRALKGILSKLDKLGRSDSEKIAILDQSIQNSWQGVFELRQDKKTNEKKLTQEEEEIIGRIGSWY